MEKKLYATFKINMENISEKLAKVIATMEALEAAVNDMQRTLSSDGVEISLNETSDRAQGDTAKTTTDELRAEIRKIAREEIERERDESARKFFEKWLKEDSATLYIKLFQELRKVIDDSEPSARADETR